MMPMHKVWLTARERGYESMPKYGVVYLDTADKVIEVEAESREEAWDLAEDKFREDHPSLCHACDAKMNLNDWYPDESEHGTYEID
jgi:hypothetical protein